MNKQTVYRAEDGELVGYVRPVPRTDHWQPLTVFGYPLGDPATFEDSVAELEARGLACLADRWSVYWPAHDRWYSCQIVETSPDNVRVRVTDLGSADFGAVRTLERPGPDELRPA